MLSGEKRYHEGSSSGQAASPLAPLGEGSPLLSVDSLPPYCDTFLILLYIIVKTRRKNTFSFLNNPATSWLGLNWLVDCIYPSRKHSLKM